MLLEGYALFALIAWPLFTTALYRNSRYKHCALSWREDLGFDMMIALAASVIWPIGWLMVLCVTGFLEGVFQRSDSNRSTLR